MLRSALDALPARIAVLDGQGAIIVVNAAWRRFAGEAAPGTARPGAGENYLAVCDAASGAGSAEAPALAAGIRAVIAGRRGKFQLEYPWHHVGERQWFEVRVTRFSGDGPGRVLVAHENITARKQTEETMRANERQRRLALEAGGLGAFEHDVERGRVAVTPEFCRIVGLPLRPGLSPDAWAARAHPDDRSRVLAAERGVLTGAAAALDVEYRICLPNGRVRWIRVLASPVAEAGAVVRVYGVVQDVTPRKEADAELRQLSRAVEQSPASIVITDAQGAIEYVNPKFSALTGYSLAEIRGQNPRVLKSGEMPPAVYRQLWRRLATGREWRGELHNRKKNGELYWESASISAIRDDRGHITHFVAVKEDITRQKQIARDLELRRSYLNAIIDHQPDLIWLKDNDDRCLVVNRAYARNRGSATPAEFIGRPLSDIWPAEFGALLRHVNRQIRDGGGTRFSVEIPLPDGTRRWGEIYMGNARDYAGSPIGIVGCARDISAEREAELRLLAATRELERANAQLQTALVRERELALAAVAANRAKTAFLASMSHELRTPLNVINGVSATMQREFAGTRPAESAGLILGCGEHLLGIISELLDFSVLQSGRGRLDLKPCDVRAVVSDAMRQLAGPARQKALVLDCRIAPGTPAGLLCDPRRLQQILLNLLQNAVKFTTHGGVHLTVSARALDAGRYRWSFSVADSGLGIARKDVGRLFQPFCQANAAIACEHGGTGLGLAISRSFAELMGGDIVVRSRPGRGSCFRCSIVAPAADVPGAIVSPPAPAAGSAAGSRLADRIPLRVLAADDNRANREALAGMLQYFGYRADFCADGAEVLAALARQPYDLVLLDVQMPVMDGLAAARQIKRLHPDATRRPKLVAITASALPGDRETILAAGLDYYLSKPVLPEHLEAGILRWFSDVPAAPLQPAAVGTAGESAGLPLIDHAHLAAAFPGQSGLRLSDVLAQMEAATLADFAMALPRLTTACAARDAVATATVLHALQGCFLTLGWKRIAGRCAVALRAARERRFDEWTSLPGELRELCAASAAAMARHRAALAAGGPSAREATVSAETRR